MDVLRLETAYGVVGRHRFRKVYGHWWKLTNPRTGELLELSPRHWQTQVQAEANARQTFGEDARRIVLFGAGEPVTLCG